jgi:hypothetical protein
MGNNIHQTGFHNERGSLHEVAIEDSPAHMAPGRVPDGGYGWVCLAACFNINCFTWGVVAVRFKKPSAYVCVGYEGPTAYYPL